jgi:hypothetical protein
VLNIVHTKYKKSKKISLKKNCAKTCAIKLHVIQRYLIITECFLQLTFFGELIVYALQTVRRQGLPLPVGQGEVVLLAEGPVPHQAACRVLQYYICFGFVLFSAVAVIAKKL